MKTKKVDVVAGYSYPNDKNALWFDQNTNTMRYWDGEKWESSQSQGSSLPTPTAEDVGKVMMVVDKKTETTDRVVIIPRQTLEMTQQNPTGGHTAKSKFGLINNWNNSAYNELKDGDYTYTIELNNNIIDTQLSSITGGNALVHNIDQQIRFNDELELCYLVDSTNELVDPVIYVYADITVIHHEYVWEMSDTDSNEDPIQQGDK